jgi:hypothetical protein
VITITIRLYPDESLYSICARIVFYSGTSKTGKNNLKSILDYSLKPFQPMEISPLTYFDSNQTVDELYLLEKHSSYPYYSHFALDEEKRELLERSIVEREFSITNQWLRPYKSKSSLQLCPVCLIEDSNTCGQPYWHRSHQLPGSIVCDIHNVMLLSECPKCAESLTPSHKHSPVITPFFCSQGHDLEHTITNTDETLLTVASNNRYLLESQKSMDFSVVREKMSILFSNEGISNGNSFYKYRITNKFNQRFNEAFIKQIGRSNETMKVSLFWNTKESIDPLFYVLFMIYFSDSVAHFLEEKIKYAPYGDGPWKCFNRVCRHYEEFIIKSVEITMAAGNPRGQFCCNECGCRYSWLNYDQVLVIIEPGPLWESECEALFQNKEVSFNEMNILFTTSYMKQKFATSTFNLDLYMSKNFSVQQKEKILKSAEYMLSKKKRVND